MTHNTQIGVMNERNEKVSDIGVPQAFSQPFRPDLIARAVLSIESNLRQPYGSDPRAGMKASAKLSRRRRDYKGAYGKGISRVPRKTMSRNGDRMTWVGAFAPGTVKGRRAHHPKAEKIWSQKMLSQERKKATMSALSATLKKEIVSARGHRLPEAFPFVIDDSFEKISKTKQLLSALNSMGFSQELERASPSIRAGKGKMRGRAKHTPRSILFVTSGRSKLSEAACNIPGLEVVEAKDVNAKHLAPGCQPGRLTLYTKSSMSVLDARFKEASNASFSAPASGSVQHKAKQTGETHSAAHTVPNPQKKAPTASKTQVQRKTPAEKSRK